MTVPDPSARAQSHTHENKSPVTERMHLGIAIRAVTVWLILIVAEILHGIARGIILVPHVGEFRSNQIGVFTGSITILAIAVVFVRWMGATPVPAGSDPPGSRTCVREGSWSRHSRNSARCRPLTEQSIAPDRRDGEQSFQVIHPFHPLYQRTFRLVNKPAIPCTASSPQET